MVFLLIDMVALGMVNVGKAEGARSRWTSNCIRNEGKWIADWSDQKTIPSDFGFFEFKNVSVPNPAPKIDEFAPVLSIYNILWRYSCSGHSGGYAPIKLNIWWNNSSACVGARVVKSIACWEDGIPNLALDIHRKISCRAKSRIFQNWFKAPIPQSGIIISFPKLAETRDKNECATTGNERLSSQISLPAGSNPKCAGKGGDNQCRKCIDAGLVPINESTRASDVIVNDGAESGWIVFGGGIVLALLVPAYACLEKWRRRTFDQNERDQQNNQPE
jgi:hypothetical protein